INYNRTTNHIAGLTIRTTSTGEERGGVVVDYALNACPSLTRYRFAQGASFDNVADALEAARKGGRKLCKHCEKAARAMVDERRTREADEKRHATHVSRVELAQHDNDNTEGGATMATTKLKMKDVRGDVRIGAVPGADA